MIGRLGATELILILCCMTSIISFAGVGTGALLIYRSRKKSSKIERL